jgi:hypothetical protein
MDTIGVHGGSRPLVFLGLSARRCSERARCMQDLAWRPQTRCWRLRHHASSHHRQQQRGGIAAALCPRPAGGTGAINAWLEQSRGHMRKSKVRHRRGSLAGTCLCCAAAHGVSQCRRCGWCQPVQALRRHREATVQAPRRSQGGASAGEAQASASVSLHLHRHQSSLPLRSHVRACMWCRTTL